MDSNESIVGTEIILPEQFYDLQKSSYRSGETRLMLAVFENGISEYMQYYRLQDNKRARKMFSEAEKWILSNDTLWIYSFVNICQRLIIDPEYVRKGLEQWKQQCALGAHQKLQRDDIGFRIKVVVPK